MFSIRYTLLLIIGVLFDQAAKQVAENHLSFFHAKELIPNVLAFQLVHNAGAAYGILQNQRILLLLVSGVVILGCYLFRHKIGVNKLTKLGLIFLLIGTIGNFIDRLVFGYVIDFIVIYIVPVFNVADVCIDIGIGLLILELFINRDSAKSKSGSNPT